MQLDLLLEVSKLPISMKLKVSVFLLSQSTMYFKLFLSSWDRRIQVGIL
jgi:hypothetical protein